MMLSNLIWWPWAQVGQGVAPAAEYHPVGDSSPALPLADLSNLPARRGRRRRREDILDLEDEIITVLLNEL